MLSYLNHTLLKAEEDCAIEVKIIICRFYFAAQVLTIACKIIDPSKGVRD